MLAFTVQKIEFNVPKMVKMEIPEGTTILIDPKEKIARYNGISFDILDHEWIPYLTTNDQ